MEAMLSAKHVDATTATREVNHLLPRHLTRTNADTFALNTVVATQQQMTGVRQRGLQRLLDKAHLHALEDAFKTFPNEEYFIHHRKDKGGRSRFAPIIGPHREEIIARFKDRQPDEKVWEHVSTGADVHSYRADYANRVYRMHTREYDDIPYDRVNPQTGIKYKSEVYYCRGDEKGRRLDRRAMRIASKALGHNRVDVIAGHYLRGL